MNKKIFSFGLVLLTVFVFGFASSVYTEAEEDSSFSIEENITLRNSCEVVDTDGITHIFPKEDSPGEFLGICAVIAALDAEYIENFSVVHFEGFGLFIDSINEITSPSAYWALWYNEEYSEDKGLVDLELSEGDSISLIFTTFDNEETGDKVILHVTALEILPSEDDEEEEIEEAPSPSGGSGGGGGSVTPPTFSATNALAYLKSVQAADGSFGSSAMYADWVAIAFGAMNETSSSRDLLLSYLTSNNTISSLLTDNERRAMALLALGENPYSFNDVDYINAIVESFDGMQFGDTNLVNDDIFALIPLSVTGYTASDEIITTAIAFIISKQNVNGSWENSVDMTSAAIQALQPFTSASGVSDSLSKASDYLQGKQDTNGGWGGISSTSWAMQAMSALGASWTNNGKIGLDYLAIQQINANNNGSVLSSSASLQNNIWETSYTISAGLGKPWSAILQSVSRPTATNNAPDDAENNELETIADAESVFCPPGDLFSTTTGKACTTTIAPVTFVAQNTSNLSASTSTQATSEVSQARELAKLEVNNLEEKISPSSLTASATSALPQKTIPTSVPIVVGVVSGSILLYAGFKFFFL